MKKLIIIEISAIVGLIILILIPINLHLNFHRNAYYYATHMPHKSNQYPFVTLLDGFYLPSSYVPGYEAERTTSSVRDPDIMWVFKKKLKTNKDMLRLSDNAIAYIPNRSNEYNNYRIFFDEYGNYDGYSKEKGVPSYSRKLLLTHLNKLQNEIKQNAPKPKVNLQWIWNIWFNLPDRYKLLL